MGINLWEGIPVRQLDTTKDMELIDFTNDTTNFYFRSGDYTKDATGFSTKFYRIYSNLDRFDTLSVIPDSNNKLDSTDFTSVDTYGNGVWGYFHLGQTGKPVYSFYLSGKYAYGQSGGYRVFGVFLIKRIESVYSPEYDSDGIRITVDIKLNKIGDNHFVR